MHEMALTQSVVDMVAERTVGRRVSVVRLRVGALAGVVADAMLFCFDVATAGTPLEGSILVIDEVRGRARCLTCADEFYVDDLILLCPCGSADVRIVEGKELLVSSVETEQQPCA
jgi:hydrogenase nickel incorporation protein HypA/HybF